jgi:hypothetical protein
VKLLGGIVDTSKDGYVSNWWTDAYVISLEMSSFFKLFLVWIKKELPHQWKDCVILSVYNDEIGNSKSLGISHMWTTGHQNFIQYSFLKVNFICWQNYWESPVRISTQ